MNELRVLVVDDSTIELDVISEALSHAKIDHMTINDSSAVMSAIEQYQPNMVILDLYMPGLSGTKICNMIKSNPLTRDIRVIFMTASDNVEDLLEGVRLQVVDYIHKPVPVKKLLERIMIADLTTCITNDFSNLERTMMSMYKKYNLQSVSH